MGRGDLSDAQWEELEPLLPPQKPRTDRENLPHRPIVDGILWHLRTGAPWRDIPERYGKWETIYSRFRRWSQKGIWQDVYEKIQQHDDFRGEIDWSIHFVDSSIIRAHQHPAGAPKKRGEEPDDHALGRSRGGFSTQIHMRVNRNGRTLGFVLTPGQTHCSTVFEQVMNVGAVKRPVGRPKLRPAILVGDKGYSSQSNRHWLRRRHINVVIPRRSNERRRGPFFKNLYRKRNRIERTVGRYKHFRALATRYTKLAAHYLSQWYIAAIVLAL